MEHRDVSIGNRAFVLAGDRYLPYWRLGLGLVLLGLVLLLFALWEDVRNARLDFARQAAALHEDVLQKLRVNEVVLAGFAAHYAVTSDMARPEVAGYIRDMLARYPHIHTMGVQSYPPQEPVPGLDADSVPHLELAMERAIASGEAVASSPFRLAAGGQAYALVQPVGPRQARDQAPGHPRHPPVLVSLVVQGRSLLDSSLFPNASLALLHGGTPTHKELYQSFPNEADRLARRVFPLLSYSDKLAGIGQPFVLHIEKQLGWEVISLPVILVLGVFVPGKRARHATEAWSRTRRRPLWSSTPAPVVSWKSTPMPSDSSVYGASSC